MNQADVDRFLSKVPAEPDENGCLIWLTCRDYDGYGMFHFNGNNVRAHRFAWEITHGAIPKDLWVLHKCDVPSCVNVDHLFLGTAQDNTLDMFAKGRAYKVRGEDHPMARLTEDDVREIRSYRGIASQGVLAEDYGVTPGLISAIWLNKLWKDDDYEIQNLKRPKRNRIALSETEVSVIKFLLEQNQLSAAELARRYKVSDQTIYRIRSGHSSWAWVQPIAPSLPLTSPIHASVWPNRRMNY
jgi:hypothetical protein